MTRLPCIWFGKHRGKRIDQVPPDYLLWLLAADDVDDGLKYAIRRHLDLDLPEPGWDVDPDPSLAAVVLPGVVWRWREAMHDRYAGDEAALAVVAAGERELRELTGTYTRKPTLPTGGVQ